MPKSRKSKDSSPAVATADDQRSYDRLLSVELARMLRRFLESFRDKYSWTVLPPAVPIDPRLAEYIVYRRELDHVKKLTAAESMLRERFGLEVWHLFNFEVLLKLRRATKEYVRARKTHEYACDRKALLRDWQKLNSFVSRLGGIKFQSPLGKQLYEPFVGRIMEDVPNLYPVGDKRVLEIVESRYKLLLSPRKKLKVRTTVDQEIDAAILRLYRLKVGEKQIAEIISQLLSVLQLPAHVTVLDPRLAPVKLSPKAATLRVRRLLKRF